MYFKLKTKPFINKIKKQNINEEMIIDALENTYKNTAFSTFPYLLYGMNSKNSIKNFKSGNCVGLSIYLKNYLKKKYNVNSFLIPASIPKKYSFPGYLDLAHVALAIPMDKKQIFIADVAFYFLNPIKSILNSKKKRIIFSKNIYSKEYSSNLRNYTSIEKIVCETKIRKIKKVFNKYQTIEKGTYYIECYTDDDSEDKWCYYLTEVINPDKAISTFFINLRNKPFICSNKMDRNGICEMNIYLKCKDDNLFKLKYDDIEEEDKLENLNKSEILKLLKPFLKEIKNCKIKRKFIIED